MVATPIGNLADIGLRALHVLQRVDLIACEDTRHTRQLLRAYGLERPAQQLLALHQHNEAQAAQTVLQALAQDQRVACVSDAGTPAISDPGARLVSAVQAAGRRVVPLPGASSVTTLLSASGLRQDNGFVFAGFLPHKGREREQALNQARQKAEERYVEKKRRATVAAGRARTELDGLRDTLYALGAPAAGQDPAAACRTDAGALERQLLGQCAAALVGVAGEADRLAAQVLGLQGYVREVCLAPK